MQPIEWKDVFANYTSDREIISKAHKELELLPNKQLNIPVKTGQDISQNI